MATRGAGDNSVAADELRKFVDRVEALEAEKAALLEDVKQIYTEAAGVGFDTKIMRKLVALRRKDEATRLEEQTVLDLYMRALGMEMLG